jgi:hypothetical protein
LEVAEQLTDLGMARASIPLGKNERTVILPHPTQNPNWPVNVAYNTLK